MAKKEWYICRGDGRMKEYIERKEVRQKIRTWIKRAEEREEYAAAECFEDCLYLLNDAPAADVVEVRHGRWRLNRNGSGTCSECGMTQNDVWDFDNWQRYCGCCGAKMDKEE